MIIRKNVSEEIEDVIINLSCPQMVLQEKGMTDDILHNATYGLILILEWKTSWKLNKKHCHNEGNQKPTAATGVEIFCLWHFKDWKIQKC